MSKVPLTVAGAEKLRAELHELKTVQRPAIVTAIAEARSHGDLSENAEYHAAKERQSFIEGRIAELESKLANAQIIDPTLLDADGRCVFGATVELEDVASGEKVTYQIVGDDEADIKQGKISISSPHRARPDRQVRRRHRRSEGAGRRARIRDSRRQVHLEAEGATAYLLRCGALPLVRLALALAARPRRTGDTDGFLAAGGASGSSGRGRKTTSILPIICTGPASSASQIRWSASSRLSRSSPSIRILMSSWLFKARSISFSTASVSPALPIITTGEGHVPARAARAALRSERFHFNALNCSAYRRMFGAWHCEPAI